ncbi:MAG: hypothetical protein RSD40_03395 [Bacilli bacterium]
MRYIGIPPLSHKIYFADNKNNYILLLIRVIANPVNGNLDSGSDCQDIIISTSREGYYYNQCTTGKMCIAIKHDSVLIGGSGEDNEFCKYGFAIYGLMHK